MRFVKLARLAAAAMLLASAFQGLPAPAKAQNFSYNSGVQVMNLSGTDTTVSLQFYNTSDGSSYGTPTSDTITANSSKTYFATTLPVSSGFNGSLVVSSQQPVAAISNILGNDGAASAAYVATSSGNTTLLFPLLMKGNSGNDTWFSVQNTGSSSASVNVAYSDGTSTSATILPGAAKQFFQKNETHSATVFSAIVTNTGTNQPLAGVAIQESTSVMYAYTGFAAGSTNPVMPLINANNGGTVTGVQIQNAGSASTNVTVSYTPSLAGTACTETQTIPAGQSKTFAFFAFANGANSTCAGGARFVGTAKVTTNSASQPLTVIVNQLHSGPNYAEAYGAFDPASATSTVVFPLIVQRSFDFSGFSVMNVGTSDTTVTCTFSGSSFTASQTLSPNQAATILMNSSVGTSYVGAGTCTASSSGKIVGVANQLGKNLTGDDFKVYEGVNRP